MRTHSQLFQRIRCENMNDMICAMWPYLRKVMTSDRAPREEDFPKTRTPGLAFSEIFRVVRWSDLGCSFFSCTGSDGCNSMMAGFSELGELCTKFVKIHQNKYCIILDDYNNNASCLQANHNLQVTVKLTFRKTVIYTTSYKQKPSWKVTCPIRNDIKVNMKWKFTLYIFLMHLKILIMNNSSIKITWSSREMTDLSLVTYTRL